MTMPTIDDLSRLELRRWKLHLGNTKAKRELRKMVRAVRVHNRRGGFRLMFRGPSRSGKTSLIQYAMKCIGCFNLNLQSLDACHECPNCLLGHHLDGNPDWERYVDLVDPHLAPTPIYYRFNYVDCTSVTTAELDDMILELGRQRNVVYIVVLDEVHRLVRRQLDERLLVPTDRKDVIWIGASVRLDQIDEMLLNRFRIIDMEKPKEKHMVAFLAHICAEFHLKCERPEQTLLQLAKRSNLVTGTALQVINAAYQSETKTLTRAMVDEYIYRLQD